MEKHLNINKMFIKLYFIGVIKALVEKPFKETDKDLFKIYVL